MENSLKEVMERLEKEMRSLDGSISNKYWIIQGLHKAWEICHKVDDVSNDSLDVLKINNSYELLKKFKLYYDRVENNIQFSDSHHDRVVSEFITEELINNTMENKWIRLKDRFPDKDGEVIIFMPELIGIGIEVGTAWWDNGERFFEDGDGDIIDFSEISHWMPLPEPPKE